ncbi:hypothetical protein CCMA1212_006674 [Trichoderma ghanense]|uniref:SSCRP protein n=1 Tax=Trichoderma ghanense TaxID=65468 RepID=A0ABY2GZG9_9HYPO
MAPSRAAAFLFARLVPAILLAPANGPSAPFARRNVLAAFGCGGCKGLDKAHARGSGIVALSAFGRLQRPCHAGLHRRVTGHGEGIALAQARLSCHSILTAAAVARRHCLVGTHWPGDPALLESPLSLVITEQRGQAAGQGPLPVRSWPCPCLASHGRENGPDGGAGAGGRRVSPVRCFTLLRLTKEGPPRGKGLTGNCFRPCSFGIMGAAKMSLAGCKTFLHCSGGGDIGALLTQSLGASAPPKCLRQSGSPVLSSAFMEVTRTTSTKGTLYQAPRAESLAVTEPLQLRGHAGSGISNSYGKLPHASSGGSVSEPMLCRVLPDPPSHWVTRTPVQEAETSCKHPELANA